MWGIESGIAWDGSWRYYANLGQTKLPFAYTRGCPWETAQGVSLLLAPCRLTPRSMLVGEFSGASGRSALFYVSDVVSSSCFSTRFGRISSFPVLSGFVGPFGHFWAFWLSGLRLFLGFRFLTCSGCGSLAACFSVHCCMVHF